MKQRSHTLGEQAAVFVWSSAAPSLFCGVNNPASPGWEPDCAVSLRLSGNPSVSARVREVRQINSTTQMFYIWIHTGGKLWGCNPGQRRSGSITLNLSLHESTTYTPGGAEQFVSLKSSLIATSKQTKGAAVFSPPTAPIKSWTCNIYVKAVRTAAELRLVWSTLQAAVVVVDKWMKTRMLKETRAWPMPANRLGVSTWKTSKRDTLPTFRTFDMLSDAAARIALPPSYDPSGGSAPRRSNETLNAGRCFPTRTRVSGGIRARNTSIVYRRDNYLNSRLGWIQLLMRTANDRFFFLFNFYLL